MQGQVGEPGVVDHEVLAQEGREGVGDRRDVLTASVEGPGPEELLAGGREGPGQADPHTGRERQDARVAQQHQGGGGTVARDLAVLGGQRHRGRAADVGVGPLEQSGPELEPQDPGDGVVEKARTHLARVHQAAEVAGVGLADHVHVYTGRQREGRGLTQVGRHAVLEQLPDGVPVADHQPVEAPLVLEDPAQHPRVCGDRDTVQVVEGAHHRGDAGAHQGLEGSKVEVAQGGGADVDRVVVPAPRGHGVPDVVLGAGGDRVDGGQVTGLEPAHRGRAQARGQHRVLAEGLRDPAPPRVGADVEHRGERPAHPVGTRLAGGHPRSRLDEVGVPGRGLPERDRRDGAVPVDDVPREEQGDAQPGGLDRRALERVGRLGPQSGVAHVPRERAAGGQGRADAARGQQVGMASQVEVGELVRLPDLLRRRHHGEEQPDTALHVEGRVHPRSLGQVRDVPRRVVHGRVTVISLPAGRSRAASSSMGISSPPVRYGLASRLAASAVPLSATSSGPWPRGPTT